MFLYDFHTCLTWNFLSLSLSSTVTVPLCGWDPGTFSFTNGPSGRTGRLWAVPTDRHWCRGCRRACCRVSALLLWDPGVRIRGLVRIRVRIRALSVVLAADRIATVAQAAGLVGAARSAAASLPRCFSLQVQVLARQIPVWLSCLQARLPRPHWPGLPSASGRRPCWRWRSGAPWRSGDPQK